MRGEGPEGASIPEEQTGLASGLWGLLTWALQPHGLGVLTLGQRNVILGVEDGPRHYCHHRQTPAASPEARPSPARRGWLDGERPRPLPICLDHPSPMKSRHLRVQPGWLT